MHSQLKITTLGRFTIQHLGQPVTGLATRKVEALLVYLACKRQAIAREVLATLFWEDQPQDKALASLRTALSSLRKSLGGYLVISKGSISIKPDENVCIDVQEFDGCLQRGDYDAAAGLYHGEFLEGFYLRGSAAFEDWVRQERERCRMLFESSLHTLIEDALRRELFSKAIAFSRQLVQANPLDEIGQRDLMRSLAYAGQRSNALAQYELCRQALDQELGVEPAVETLQLIEAIRTGSLESPLHVKLPPNNLPVQLSRLFGRQEDIALLKQRLAEGRLVTLTGAGGVGKTRLALQVAQETLESFPDGTWLVELAALVDPSLVDQQAAVTLGLDVNAGTLALESVKQALHNQRTLLVLDNCEHLCDSVAHLVEGLLRACPGLRILATSRQSLGLNGETVMRVPSLSFPVSGQALIAHGPEAYASVGLFVERARQVQPGFSISTENAEAVASICRRLDGIPLALELAAARLSLLSSEELAYRLDKTFWLLNSGSRTALTRQQTLRATVDWSYQLLSEEERFLFRRLAVFAGDWSLAAAEEVCAGEGPKPGETLDRLAGLVDKSIVSVLPVLGSQTRYRMLEVIRQYAREKLDESGEMKRVQACHLAYFISMAEVGDAEIKGLRQVEWLQKLTAELENYRLALVFSLEADPHAGLRLASALQGFWGRKNWNEEGSRWLKACLSRPENAPWDALRAKALWRLGLLSSSEPGSEQWPGESLEISKRLNDISGQGMAHFAIGFCLISKEDYRKAKTHFESAVEIFEETRNHSGLASALGCLSFTAMFSGDYETQLSSRERGVALHRKLKEPHELSVGLQFLSDTVMIAGELDRGWELIQEAMIIDHQVEPDGFRFDVGYSCADILCWQGEYQAARLFMDRMLDIRRQLHSEEGFTQAEFAVGRFECLLGDLEKGTARMEKSLHFYQEHGIYHHLLDLQQTFLMELAYDWGCKGETRRARSVIEHYHHLFRAPYYQPSLAIVKGLLDLVDFDSHSAANHYRTGLRLAEQSGRHLLSLLALEGYAWALQLRGQPEQSASLLGAAAEFRDRIGACVFPRDRAWYGQVITTLKASLGEAGYAASWSEGQRKGFDRAAKDVLLV